MANQLEGVRPVNNLTVYMNTMPYTLGEAARATGKSKAAISQAIASHKISATKDAHGRFQIEPAELHRLYPPQKTIPNVAEHHFTPNQTAEVERLKATVEGLERLCRQIEGERDSLRDQNTRLTALLSAPKPTEGEVSRRRWWQFGKP
ncbi:MAG: DNA-binding protein [Alphaproteobacteria bacterium]|nr:DNA-binding protein [Alphaproteobacteria bacterium]